MMMMMMRGRLAAGDMASRARVLSVRLAWLLTTVCLIHTVRGQDWSYTNVPDWYLYGAACNTSTQSPINFQQSQTLYLANLSALTFTNYDQLLLSYTGYEVTNNGHTVITTLTYNNASVTLSGGGLPVPYILYQFHFHWGSVDTQGSEHTVDWARFPMEAHFVHYSSNYASYAQASNLTDGLAVLAAFVQIVPKGSTPFGDIAEVLNGVPFETNAVPYKDTFALRDILPSNTQDYYLYRGSLTTPPCFNSVIWTVLKQATTISETQLQVFRTSLYENTAGEPDIQMINNFRPSQTINGRSIYRSFALTRDWSYADVPGWSLLYPNCSGGQQSPVNLATGGATLDLSLGPLSFNGYTQTLPLNVTNTGYSLSATLGSGRGAGVSGGGLPSGVQYSLYQITLHWGADSNSGSEHSVNGAPYPAEIQLLHFASQYGTFDNASMFPGGLAALAVFCQVNDNAPGGGPALLAALPALQYAGSSTILPSFLPSSLLPSSTAAYYRYTGSLTTPKCTQGVPWTVFNTPLTITSAQMNSLRTALYSTPAGAAVALVGQNSRPLQALNGRTISLSASFNSSPSPAPSQSGVSARHLGAMTGLVWALLALLQQLC